MSSKPTGRPAASTTGSSLILCRRSISTASTTRVPSGTVIGSARHDLADRPIQGGVAALLEQPGQVAVGEQAAQPAVGVGQHDGAGAPAAAAGPGRTPSRTVSLAGGQAQLVAAAHDRLDLEQLAAQAAGRVEAGEVLVREVAHPAQHEGQGVADGDHGRGAGAGRQAERTDLLQRAEHEGDVGRAGQRAVAVAGQARRWPSASCRSGPQQPDDLLALAAVRQDQDDVVGMDHAQVAVDGPGGVEDVGAGAGRVERAGDLLADVGRLAGAGDADAPGAAAEELDGLQERLVEPLGHLEQGSRFFAHDLTRIGERVEKLGGIVDLQRHGKHPCEPPAPRERAGSRRCFTRRLYWPTWEKQRQAGREARGRVAFVVHAVGFLEEIQKRCPRRQTR